MTKKNASVEVKIPFEGNAELYVDSGKKVKVGDTLFRVSQKIIKESYYLPKVFGIKPEKAMDYIGRVSGEYVLKGDLVAERLASGGLVNKMIYAGVDGIISLERIEKGFIDILSETEERVVESKLDGTVKAIRLNNSVVLEADAASMPVFASRNLSLAISEVTEQIVGEFDLLGDGSSIYTVKDLEDAYEGKIVFAGKYLYPDLAMKLYEKDAICIVAYSMDYDAFKDFTLPIILLGGFGHIKINGYLLSYMRDAVGRFVQLLPGLDNLFFINGSGVDLEKYRGVSYFKGNLNDGDLVVSRDAEHFNVEGSVSYVGVEDVDEFTLVNSTDGSRFIADKASLDYLVK